MSAKPVVPREQASQDIEDAIDYYLREAGETVALAFIDATESAFRAIARNAAIGSPRYAHELDLPGLRTRSLRRYPYLVFYVEQNDHIDGWRVLHAHRDIPAWMHDPQGD
jgi:toxin ParE1/3/4